MISHGGSGSLFLSPLQWFCPGPLLEGSVKAEIRAGSWLRPLQGRADSEFVAVPSDLESGVNKRNRSNEVIHLLLDLNESPAEHENEGAEGGEPLG